MESLIRLLLDKIAPGQSWDGRRTVVRRSSDGRREVVRRSSDGRRAVKTFFDVEDDIHFCAPAPGGGFILRLGLKAKRTTKIGIMVKGHRRTIINQKFKISKKIQKIDFCSFSKLPKNY